MCEAVELALERLRERLIRFARRPDVPEVVGDAPHVRERRDLGCVRRIRRAGRKAEDDVPARFVDSPPNLANLAHLVRMVGDAVHLEEIDAPARRTASAARHTRPDPRRCRARPSSSGPTGRHRWCPPRLWRESSNPRWEGYARPKRAESRARYGCRRAVPAREPNRASGLKLGLLDRRGQLRLHATRLRDDMNTTLRRRKSRRHRDISPMRIDRIAQRVRLRPIFAGSRRTSPRR